LSHIVFPLPSWDFDPTEAAVSWRVLTDLGHRVSFSTPDGKPAQADPIMLTGRGLDPWSPVPLIGNLKLFGLMLRANADARACYARMIQSAAYQSPLRWDAGIAADFDGVLLAGGHCARGMREYLESEILKKLVADFFAAKKPVAAICHGVLLAARSKDASGRSVLFSRRTTALTWKLEAAASAIARFTRIWDPNYYRTYPDEPGQPKGYMSVQQEVTRYLESPSQFLDVPPSTPDHRLKTSGTHRDTKEDSRSAWVVRDGNYVSARWPGDAYTFARTFAEVLSGAPG
jgi:putative intracellular protease/amidase